MRRAYEMLASVAVATREEVVAARQRKELPMDRENRRKLEEAMVVRDMAGRGRATV
jgi:hypothetical protein